VDYFTADLHLDHPNILWYSAARGRFLSEAERAKRAEIGPRREGVKFKPSRASIERMNEAILDGINAAVGKKDRLWILGDFAVKTTAARTAEFRERIKCRDVRIIYGNHDDRAVCREVFDACYDAVMVHVPVENGGASMTEDEVQRAVGKGTLSGRGAKRMGRVYLSHYAHVVWQASHKGVYHLYGHSHGNLEAWRERAMPSALSMDAGVDTHDFRPWSWEEVDRVLREKARRVPPHTVDHHRADTD
jgi:calcineurin-like phosphoesterase family protein